MSRYEKLTATVLSVIMVTSLFVGFVMLPSLPGSQHTGVAEAQEETDNGSVYVGGQSANITSLDAETGEEQWTFTANDYVSASPTVRYGMVYVPERNMNGDRLYALDQDNGSEVWSHSTFSSWTSPTIRNDTVYYGDEAGYVRALDAHTGDVKWEWQQADTARIRSSPTVVNGTVYAGSASNEVYALDADTGDEKWSYATGSNVRSSPTVANGVVYFGSGDDNVYAVDADTGEEVWTHQTGGSVRSSPTYYDGVVYVGSNDNNMYALDADTGDEIWSYTTGDQIDEGGATVDGSLVFFGSEDGDLYAVDRSSGDLEWSTSTGNSISGVPTVSNETDTIFIGSYDNNVYAFDTATGDQKWSYDTGAPVSLSSPTYTSGDSDKSDGSRVLQHTLGHHDMRVGLSASGSSVAGEVIDQNGEPVPNATVEIWGVDYDELEETGEEAEQTADDLFEEAMNTEPPDFDSELDLERDVFEAAGDDYVAVHTREDWGMYEWTDVPDLSQPIVHHKDPKREVVLSIWDPDDGGLDGVSRDLPGRPTDGTIVIEALDHKGDVVWTREKPTDQSYDIGAGMITLRSHPYTTANLPAGFYRISAKDSDVSYILMVGDPIDVIDPGLQDPTGTFTDAAINTRDLLDQNKFQRTTVTTDENGEFTATLDGNVKTVGVQAWKHPELNYKEPSLQDLRDAREGGYKGAVYLTTEPVLTEPPDENVVVRTQKFDFDPYGILDTFEEWLEWLEEQFSSEFAEHLASMFGEDITDLDRETVEELHNDFEDMREENEELNERVSNRISDEIDNKEDYELTDEELREKLEAMEEVINEMQDELETIESGGEVENGLLNYEVIFDEEIAPTGVSVYVNYEDGTTDPVADEYVEVDSTGFTDSQTAVRVNDYPLKDGAAIADVRVVVASEDGVGGDSEKLPNDQFDGEIPVINAIDFSSVQPGPDETVTTGLIAEQDTGYGNLTDVKVYGPDGSELPANVSNDEASFTTNGEGVHHVRYEYTNEQGHTFVESARIRALAVDIRGPASIRVSEGVTGYFAIVGEGVESGYVKYVDLDQSLKVTGVVPGDDIPRTVHVYPDEGLSGTHDRLDASIVAGASEERVNRHITLNIHTHRVSDDTLVYRQGTQPITHDGDTKYGEIDEQGNNSYTVRTYTDDEGAVTTIANHDPSLVDRALFTIRVRFPFIVSMVTFDSGQTILTAGLDADYGPPVDVFEMEALADLLTDAIDISSPLQTSAGDGAVAAAGPEQPVSLVAA